MIKKIEDEDKADIERCMRLYLADKRNSAHTANDLVQDIVLGRQVIIYRHVTLIEKMRQLRMAIF
jgi:hypothetical protein